MSLNKDDLDMLNQINELKFDDIEKVKENQSKLQLRKCLTYVDEYEYDIVRGKIKSINIVSFTALKREYIENIESNWMEIRKTYGFSQGWPIHFTRLREITRKHKYINLAGQEVETDGWNEKSIVQEYKQLVKKPIESRLKDTKNFLERYSMWKPFRKENNEGIGVLDTNKLKKFYDDIFSAIKSFKLSIICTTFIFDPKANHKMEHVVHSSQIRRPYFMAFLEHLNILNFYLRHGYLSQDNLKEKDSLYKQNFTTKLRCDGDDGYGGKDDYRLAFNQSVTSGTREFSGQAIMKTIDEIRFINKREIGYYSDKENKSIVSHIGCDIADLLAYYVGMHSIKENLLEIDMNKGLTREDAELSFKNKVTFNIDGKTFDPYELCMSNKIINRNNYSTIQKIRDCNFLLLE